MRRGFGLVLVVGVLAVAWVMRAPSTAVGDEPQGAPTKEAVERTRQTVKMLDDIYKTAVVLITEQYVHDENDFSAGSAAVALFDAIGEKGWHKARLVDLTGNPFDPDNVVNDAFEKGAAKKILAGEGFVDAVEVDKEGKPVLRAMTAVPVVLAKCAMCHPQYEDAPKGKAIGAISYTIPVR